jgi:hypothetical protein
MGECRQCANEYREEPQQKNADAGGYYRLDWRSTHNGVSAGTGCTRFGRVSLQRRLRIVDRLAAEPRSLLPALSGWVGNLNNGE